MEERGSSRRALLERYRKSPWKLSSTQLSSVFFTNFPDDWMDKSMWLTFMNYGKAIDLFIPPRRDRSRNRFVSVRFLKEQSITSLVRSLEGIWVSTFKLQVATTRGRMGRSPGSPKKRMVCSFEKAQAGRFQKTFKDALLSNERLSHQSEKVPPLSPVDVSVDIKHSQWLQDCFVGRTLHDLQPKDVLARRWDTLIALDSRTRNMERVEWPQLQEAIGSAAFVVPQKGWSEGERKGEKFGPTEIVDEAEISRRGKEAVKERKGKAVRVHMVEEQLLVSSVVSEVAFKELMECCGGSPSAKYLVGTHIDSDVVAFVDKTGQAHTLLVPNSPSAGGDTYRGTVKKNLFFWDSTFRSVG
ncbi:hypothetical protein Ancab_032087 [Ancistrocladus abbreviatus]